MKKFLPVLFAFTILISLVGCGGGNESGGNSNTNTSKSEEKKELTLGSTFEFDDLEITIGNKVSFDKVDNEFSDYYGKTVVAIPMTVKNLKEDSHIFNSFFVKPFSADGNQSPTFSFLFDDSIDAGKAMQQGATQEGNFYILYTGDGDYIMELDNFSTKMKVKIPVKKD